MLLPPMTTAVPSGRSAGYAPQPSTDRRRRRRDSLSPPPPYSPRSPGLRAPMRFHLQQVRPSDAQVRSEPPPPPYAPRRTAFQRPSPHPAIAARALLLYRSNERVERLRRFLSFTLAIDYDLQDSTPDRLSAPDWTRFVQLAQQMSDACSAADEDDLNDTSNLDESLKSLLTPALRLHIEEPAVILGVRLQTVLSQLRLFTSSIYRCKDGSGYPSQLERMPADQGIRIFGQKLIHDRAELIEAVLPKHPKALCPFRGLKLQMLVRNETITDRWFVRLDERDYVTRKGHARQFAEEMPFPVKIFEKEAKDTVSLSMLLQSNRSNTLLSCWSRRKYLHAKRREHKLYVVDNAEEERRESCSMKSLWRLMDRCCA